MQTDARTEKNRKVFPDARTRACQKSKSWQSQAQARRGVSPGERHAHTGCLSSRGEPILCGRLFRSVSSARTSRYCWCRFGILSHGGDTTEVRAYLLIHCASLDVWESACGPWKCLGVTTFTPEPWMPLKEFSCEVCPSPLTQFCSGSLGSRACMDRWKQNILGASPVGLKTVFFRPLLRWRGSTSAHKGSH